MEHLSKQQLILLALLVSFVTSLSTGIFTVSLMSQAPKSVMQTINQVVEKTIEKAVTPNGTAGIADTADSFLGKNISDVVVSVSKNLVKIANPEDNNTVIGLGLILTKKGVVMADKSTLAKANSYNIIFSDGSVAPMKVILSQNAGDIAFLMPEIGAKIPNVTPISYADSVLIGEKVYYINGTSTLILQDGLIVSAGSTGVLKMGNDSSPVHTNILVEKDSLGGILFDASGGIIGFNAFSQERSSAGSDFYPVSNIRQVVQSL